MTRRSLKPGQPLLLGVLHLHEYRGIRSTPGMGLDVYCPYCRRMHNHGWTPESPKLDVVEHRAAHCGPAESSPFVDGGYWIGLDPAHKVVNKQVLADYADLFARWSSLREGSDRPAHRVPTSQR